MDRFESSGAPRAGLLALGLLALAMLTIRFRSVVGRPSSVIVKRLRALCTPANWPLTASTGRLLLLEAVLLQGVHEMEHIVQVVQRYLLNIKLGNGMFGSVFDLEPVHFVYNVMLLGLLVLAYVGCRKAGAIPRNRSIVLALLTITLVAQSYHSVEHVVKMVQYLETGRNGVPGILGQWFFVVWLHFWFNTLIYIPLLVAFIVGGFPSALWRQLSRNLPRSTRRQAGAVAGGAAM